jgi:hypothetical protein
MVSTKPTRVRSTPEVLVLGLAGATAALAFLLDVGTGGWEMLVVALPLLAICVGHFLLQRAAAGKVAGWSAWAILPFALADLILLQVILLQEHVGDGPTWLTITAIVGGGAGSNLTEPPSWNPGVFLGILVLLAWSLVVAASVVHRPFVRGASVLLLALISFGLLAPIAITGGDEIRAQATAAQKVKAQQEALDKAIGPAPPVCAGPAVPQHPAQKDSIWESEAPSIGRAPVWFHIDKLSIEKERAVLHLAQVYQLERGSAGWKVFAEWLTDGSFGDVIHVMITDASGVPIGMNASAPMPDPTLLEPANAKTISLPPVPPYRIYVNTVEFPKAGCYTVRAAWPGDSWDLTLAVGK